MATHKIGFDSDVTSYNDADLFTFSNNPKAHDSMMETQKAMQEMPFSKFHWFQDRGGVKPRTFVLNGYFHGSGKETDILALGKRIFDRDSTNSSLLRYYKGSSSKFFYCTGQSLKESESGRRNNFIDYIAILACPVPFAYSDTGRSAGWDITSANATTINSSNDNGTGDGAFINNGNAPSHVLQWSITNNHGSANITRVDIGDAAVSGSAVQGNIITWTGTLAAGATLNIYLFKVVDGVFKLLYYTVAGAVSGSRTIGSSEPPFIAAGATNQSFSVKCTNSSGTPTYNVSPVWRDAYWR